MPHRHNKPSPFFGDSESVEMAFLRTTTIDNPQLYDYKEAYLTAGRPGRYTENKAYSRRVSVGGSLPSYPTFSLAPYGGFELGTNAENLLRSKAYESIIDQMKGPTSSLGNAVGEWRSSYDMIARRAIQLRGAMKAFRKGEVLRAAELLTVPEDTIRKARKLARTRRGRWRKVDDGASARHWASSLWLETYFGWLPAIGDVYDSLEVLSDPIRNPVSVVGRSSSQSADHFVDARYGSSGQELGTLMYGNVTKRSNYYAKVEVLNQNLFLANRMGLVNPFSVAWELVPFSFVADWFTNVGQILESLTDLAGLNVYDSGYSTKRTSHQTHLEYWPPGAVYTSVRSDTTQFIRSPGALMSPPLAFRSPVTASWKRAATQISLLNGSFKIR